MLQARPADKDLVLECNRSGTVSTIYLLPLNLSSKHLGPSYFWSKTNPWIQCRGYVDAMSFAKSLPVVDAQCLALWGDSFAGGLVVVVAACDKRAKAAVAQCPSIGAEFPSMSPSAGLLRQIKKSLLKGDVAGPPETTTGPLLVVSFDQGGHTVIACPDPGISLVDRLRGKTGFWLGKIESHASSLRRRSSTTRACALHSWRLKP